MKEKKRTLGIGILTAILLAVALVFTGCNDDPEPEQETPDIVQTPAEVVAAETAKKAFFETGIAEYATGLASAASAHQILGDTIYLFYTDEFSLDIEGWELVDYTFDANATAMAIYTVQNTAAPSVTFDVALIPAAEYIVTWDAGVADGAKFRIRNETYEKSDELESFTVLVRAGVAVPLDALGTNLVLALGDDEFNTSISKARGTYEVVIKVTTGPVQLVNIDWMQFLDLNIEADFEGTINAKTTTTLTTNEAVVWTVNGVGQGEAKTSISTDILIVGTNYINLRNGNKSINIIFNVVFE